MCGIVGIIGDLEYRDKEVLRDLLIVCQLRGEDSTGIAFGGRKDDPDMLKVVGPPNELFNTVRYDRLSLFDKTFVIGHCRKATQGVVNRTNAHPYEFGPLMGVHNGTLRNWRQLPGDSLGTDSATLYSVMARLGVRETIEQTDGAYALVWHDRETGMINFLRNKERTLYYAFNETGTKMYFASEAWMLNITLGRNGVKMMDLTPKESYTTTTEAFKEDTLYRVRIGGKGKDALVFQADEEIKGDVKKPIGAVNFRPGFVPYPWQAAEPLVDSRPSNVGPVSSVKAGGSGTTSSSSCSTSKTATSHSQTASPQPRPMLSLVADNKKSGSDSSSSGDQLNDPLPSFGNELEGHNGLILTKEEYEGIVKPNCVWCQVPHSFEELKDEGKLGGWVQDDEFICSSCLTINKREGIC